MVEQKKLMLILKDIAIPVSSRTDAYKSVIVAWKTAMTTMEKMIVGMPQQVQDGSVILELSSWHLYPRIIALADKVVEVDLKDPLISGGGDLTVGMQSFDGEKRGVTWSLSLAHLRFYGEPVLTRRTVDSDSSRISFNNFLSVVLGSVTHSWYGVTDDVLSVNEWFTLSWDYLQEYWASKMGQAVESACDVVIVSNGWFELLTRAARNILASQGAEQDEHIMLFKYGQRNGRAFLTKGVEHSPSIFGLSRPSTLIKLCRTEQQKSTFCVE